MREGAYPVKRARELRKRLTPQEARLWVYLRTLRADGFHFRRQAPFKGFFLDFVCFGSRLVVEADGGHHNEAVQADHDAMRDAILARAGLKTMRIQNGEIDRNFDGVVCHIRRELGIDDAPEGALQYLRA
ncbi:MAG TPA: DUF559 domain-containing protein [Caulobacteraceae bacterium]|jgi:very-short-patch-repair endonuclease